MEERIPEKQRIRKGATKKTVLFYTILFLVMIGFIYGSFFLLHKSFIWESDGFTQHYTLFKEYIGLLQEFLSNPANGFPMWDWTIGLGADVITSYGYYVVGDPFVYLGVFFPESMMELAFHLLILLRVYCIGLSFLYFSREVRLTSPSGALLGTLIYTFSYYAILNVTRHPFFLIPMILFPLLAVGIERIVKEKRNLLFIFTISISALSNFYFFYMLTLMSFVYALVRYLNLYGWKPFKQTLKSAWTVLYSYLIGLVIASVLFLPMAWAFFQSSRQTTEFAMGLTIYPLEYYLLLLNNLFIPSRYLWTVVGVSVFVLFVFPMLFFRRKQYAFIPVMLSLFCLFLLLPAFASIWNGFSAPYNRWTFAIPFFLGLAAAILYDQRFTLRKKELVTMSILFLFLPVLTVLNFQFGGFGISYAIVFLLAGGMLTLFVFANVKKKGKKLSPAFKRGYSIGLFFFVIVNLVFNALVYYAPWGQNTMEELLDYGVADEKIENVFGQAEQWIPDRNEEDPFRIANTSEDNHIRNHMTALNQMGTNSYLSLTNGAVANFARQLETGQFQLIQPVRNGFDDRRIANHVLGVRYIVTEAENELYLPRGYEVVHQEETQDQNFIVVETEDAYPFAYAQQNYMTEEEFRELNPVEREVFLSYGAVLNNEDVAEGLLPFNQEANPLNVTEVPAEINAEDSEGIEETTEGLVVRNPDERVALQIESSEELANAETFLYLEGLSYTPQSNETFIREETSYTARATINDRTKSIHQSDLFSFSSYTHRDSMLFHLGYQETAPDRIELQLDGAGEYTVEEAKIFSLPEEESYQERVAEKRRNALEINTFEEDEICGVLSQDEPSILTTSIPYSEGWRAEVNGQPVETIQVNEGFVGLPLERGRSEITLSYRTPYLLPGAALTLSGLVLLVGNQWYKKEKN